MLDHLIFNRLKWFNIADNADSAVINSRKYVALPSQVTVPAGTEIITIMSEKTFPNDDTFLNNTDLKVCGEISNGTDYYIVQGTVKGNVYTQLDGMFAVPKSQVQNVIWGGKTHLNTLLSRLGATFRKVVPVC